MGNEKNPFVIDRWPTGKNLVAFTYDDEPDRSITESILKIFAGRGAATFFITAWAFARDTDNNSSICKDLLEAGMEIGNHSTTHRALPNLTDDEIYAELMLPHNMVSSLGGQMSTLRFPGLHRDDATVDRIRRNVFTKAPLNEYRMIDITIESADSGGLKAREMYEKVIHRKWYYEADTPNDPEKPGAFDGAIILLHDGRGPYGPRAETPEGSRLLIDWFLTHGYELVTVSQMLSYPRI